jgi:hypothetical protein
MGRSEEFNVGTVAPPLIRQTVPGRAHDTVHLDYVSVFHSDEDLAKHAGLSSRHTGYDVQHYPDEPSATVRLWKD